MKDPAFLFYPGDYLRDTQCLSDKTQVAYDKIMCEQRRKIYIPERLFNLFTKGLTRDEVEELKLIVLKNKDGYQIPWVTESITKRTAYSESRRKNRRGKINNISKSYDKHMENENENSLLREKIKTNKNEIETEIINEGIDVSKMDELPVIESTRKYSDNN
jgi:hypothetical protein